MGLSCIAYHNIQEYMGEDEDGGKFFYNHPAFPYAARDISENIRYTYEWSDGFLNCSYTTFGQWRRWLACSVGWDSFEDAVSNGKLGDPFYELLNFSDCEGVLGTRVCKKLLKDFLTYEDKIKECCDNDDFFFIYYLQWIRGLEAASNQGCIEFG